MLGFLRSTPLLPYWYVGKFSRPVRKMITANFICAQRPSSSYDDAKGSNEFNISRCFLSYRKGSLEKGMNVDWRRGLVSRILLLHAFLVVPFSLLLYYNICGTFSPNCTLPCIIRYLNCTDIMANLMVYLGKCP